MWVLQGPVLSAGFGGRGFSEGMLKRFSSLILALLLGGSALAATAGRQSEHVCDTAGIDVGHGPEGSSCFKEHEGLIISTSSSGSDLCCFTTPQESGSPATTFNLNSPSFSVAVSHRSINYSLLTVLRPYDSFYSPVLPDLQRSYIRNLSLLI